MPDVPDRYSSSYSQPGETWLVQRGFSANPFENTNAEFEQAELPAYYIDQGKLDEILSSRKACLIFAARGCGKTAQRQMLASMCFPGQPRAVRLAIHYVYAGMERALAASAGRLAQVSTAAHVDAILFAGVEALAQALQASPRLIDPLRQAEPSLLLDAYLARYNPGMEAPPASQADLLRLDQMTPSMKLHGFADLLVAAGIQPGMVFVDGLDELPETAGSLEPVADFLSNLLGVLPIIETPGLAFRFFLPADLEPVLAQRAWYRRDRLAVMHIRWQTEELLRLLQERLTFFSPEHNPPYDDLRQLCDESLSPLINQELIERAGKQPRAVLQLANRLLAQHMAQPNPPDRISLETWRTVAAQFVAEREAGQPAAVEEAPVLRVDKASAQVWLGEKEVRTHLTPQDYEVLICLFEKAGSLCSKNYLAECAWGGGERAVHISDETIATSITRIRRVLNKHSSGWEYIDNVRGGRADGGYRLFPAGLVRRFKP